MVYVWGSDDNTMPWNSVILNCWKKGKDLTSAQALSGDDQLTGRVFAGSKIREKNVMGGSVLLLKEYRYKMNSELKLS